MTQVMTAVVQVAQGVAGGWAYVEAGAQVLMAALSQLGSKLGESIGYLVGTTSAGQQNGSMWVSLGNVVAFVAGFIVSAIGVLVSVISAAVSVISAAIQIVMSVFSGLADVVTGVVFIIGGLFSGSWTDIWTGMKLVVFGVVDAIMGVLMELAGAIAGILDSLGSLVGAKPELQSSVRGFKDYVHREMGKDFGVETLSFTPAKGALSRTPVPMSGPEVTPAKGVPSPMPPQPTGTPPVAFAPTPARRAGASPAAFAPTAASPPPPSIPAASEARAAAPPPPPAMPAVAAVRAAIPAPPPAVTVNVPPQPPIHVNLQVDGQTLASVVHRADRDAATRTFSPVPAY